MTALCIIYILGSLSLIAYLVLIAIGSQAVGESLCEELNAAQIQVELLKQERDKVWKLVDSLQAQNEILLEHSEQHIPTILQAEAANVS